MIVKINNEIQSCFDQKLWKLLNFRQPSFMHPKNKFYSEKIGPLFKKYFKKYLSNASDATLFSYLLKNDETSCYGLAKCLLSL